MKKILFLIFFLFFISIFSDQLFKNLDRFKDSIWFDMEIKSPVDGYVQLFYNESKSNPITLNIQKSESFKKYSIELSEINIQKLRLNPVISTEEVFYQNFSIRMNRKTIRLNSYQLEPIKQIESLKYYDRNIKETSRFSSELIGVKTVKVANDPSTFIYLKENLNFFNNRARIIANITLSAIISFCLLLLVLNSKFQIVQIDFSKLSSNLYKVAITCLILYKSMIISDISLPFIQSPHDHSLYIDVGYNIYKDFSIGEYDSRSLIKLPGLAFFLSLCRTIGVPYLFALHILYTLSCLYFLQTLKRFKVNRWICVLVFVYLYFIPLTFGSLWNKADRFGLFFILLLFWIISYMNIYLDIRKKQFSKTHTMIFITSFALLFFVREEAKIFYVFLFLMLLGFLFPWRKLDWKKYFWKISIRWVYICLFSLILLSIISFSIKYFYYRDMGTSVVHEISEGEYPKFLAALRRYSYRDKIGFAFPIKRSSLMEIAEKIPELRDMKETYDPVGTSHYNEEWVYGLQIFWIKDAIFFTGKTNTAIQTQQFYKKMREEIDRICDQEGRNINDGDSLMPLFSFAIIPEIYSGFLHYFQLLLFDKGFWEIPDSSYRNTNEQLSKKHAVVTLTPEIYNESFIVQHQKERDTISRFYTNSLHLIFSISLFVGLLSIIIYKSRIHFFIFMQFLILAFTFIRIFTFSYISVFFAGINPRFLFPDLGLLIIFLPIVLINPLLLRQLELYYRKIKRLTFTTFSNIINRT